MDNQVSGEAAQLPGNTLVRRPQRAPCRKFVLFIQDSETNLFESVRLLKRHNETGLTGGLSAEYHARHASRGRSIVCRRRGDSNLSSNRFV